MSAHSRPLIGETAVPRPRSWLGDRFELARGGTGHNLRPMEGLRGFAVFLVFLVHYVTLIQPWLAEDAMIRPWTDALHAAGNAGVDLFFVLSGYLIYGSLLTRQQPFFRFMRRRIQRIYPAFAAVFGIYLVLSFIFPAESKIPAPASAGLVYLVQNLLLLPGIFPIEPLITVAWSLSYEMLYYWLIPLVIAIVRLRERSRGERIGLFVILAIGLFSHGAVYGGPVRLAMFISGILLFEAQNSSSVPTPTSIAGVAALFLGLSGMALPVTGPTGYTLKIGILFGAFFILCLACFRAPRGGLARFFSWIPLRWLGNMSYSYYLVHGLALKTGFLLLPRILGNDSRFGAEFFFGLLPPMFLWTLIPSALLFLSIERPWSLAPAKHR